MIFKTKVLQDAVNKILPAVDSGSFTNELSSIVSETLELVVVGNHLQLNVTNGEYYARVKIELDTSINEDFRAVVDAKLFLNLVSKFTTDDIELKLTQTTLIVKGNGTYKLPLIYDNNDLVVIPQIKIDNVTSEFNINSEVLLSILNYNTREIQKDEVSKPIQRLYYVDEKGCITFTVGACVNSFTLEKPVKLLLNQKLVKLFKLFKDEESVRFNLGYDMVGNVLQTKVKFETDEVSITAITSTDDKLLQTIKVDGIRHRAFDNYTYSVLVSKNSLIQSLSRLLLFSNVQSGTYTNFGTLEFSNDAVSIYDMNKDNREIIYYASGENNSTEDYSAIIDIKKLKTILDGCTDDYVIIRFGNHQCIVVSRGKISNIIPEAVKN